MCRSREGKCMEKCRRKDEQKNGGIVKEELDESVDVRKEGEGKTA